MTATQFFTLLGGVGLFLYGMTIMSTGLQNAAGDKLRVLLEKVTSNKYMAVLLGIAVTVLIQSSSATDMMVIGFVNSGLMEITQAIGVIMGANIGTTVTAQITAFDLSAFAPVLLFCGCVMALFMKKQVVRNIGSITDRGLYYTNIQAGQKESQNENQASDGERARQAANLQETADHYLHRLIRWVETNMPEQFKGHPEDAYNRDNDYKHTFWA